MKTPEQMAEEYADNSDELRGHFPWKQLKDSYLAGYQAAMNSPEKLDSCDHILDMEKMVDVNSSNNSNGWISVKERLPEIEQSSFAMRKESTCVLIASADKVYVAHLCEKWCDRTQVIFEACDCNCRGHDMEQDEWELDQVTHWMPLPKPPEEK